MRVADAGVWLDDNDVTVTIDCAKNDVVEVNGNGIRLTLKGTCNRVDLNGNRNTLTGSVKLLGIAGFRNTANLDAVDVVMVVSDENTVTYETRSKPHVHNSGKQNRIMPAK